MAELAKEHRPARHNARHHDSTRRGARLDRKRFYDSALWQETREAKLRRDPLCQCCAYVGIITQGGDVDHWIPLAQGGHPTADDNLVTLCHSCHSSKTQAELTGGPLPKVAPSRAREIVIA